ncbi:MAG: glycogen synthase, partial [Lewinellaceae bacterium]|nr:glycogen synthase [Lewinellaceae bacterium]
MIASECVPYAKTGGLADVVGALPKALKQMGHDVRIIIPRYASIDAKKFGIMPYHRPMGVWMGGVEEWCSVDQARTEEGVPVYFIEHHGYFGREGIYNNARNEDYLDNPRRFAFFTRAALQLCIDRNFKADIIHVHDWPTAPAAAYLKTWFQGSTVLGGAASVLTIHNIAHQGKYGRDQYGYTGLGWEQFTAEKFEDLGNINYLKGGIHFADMVATVSPTYAEETRNSELGAGLNTYLQAKGEAYTGILNGVDYGEWNPETDPLIPARYSAGNLQGKAVCKEALQQHFGLEVDPYVPLFGVVSRFASQKGLDLLYPAIHSVLKE